MGSDFIIIEDMVSETSKGSMLLNIFIYIYFFGKVATLEGELLSVLQRLPFNCNMWRISLLFQGELVKDLGFVKLAVSPNISSASEKQTSVIWNS